MKGNLYTLLYAAILGSVCALLLTGVGQFTAPYRRANARAEEVRNILAVLEVSFERDASANELLKIFKKKVRKQKRGEMIVYEYVGAEAGKSVQVIAIPFAGRGLWGPIKGFLALESDMKTIRGVTFHEQEETPGLGGEIGSKWFRDQFKGKSIYGKDGKAEIRLRYGVEEMGPNEVDAITGATMTCDKVEAILNKTIREIAKEFGKNGQ